jgi:hypothetical protein
MRFKQKEQERAGNFSTQNRDQGTVQPKFQDNRPEFLMQLKLNSLANSGTSNIGTVQRYPEAMDDDNAKALGSLYNEDYNKDGDDFTEEELSEIKSGVFMLTPLSPKGMACNCIGWSQDSDSIEDVGSLYTWENRDGYTPTEPEAGDAKIILWGLKEDDNDENKWKILHASVLLSHSEIVERSKNYGGFEEISAESLVEAGVPNPSWTSAGGFGFGVIVHPRNWHEGGDFGTSLKGMK